MTIIGKISANKAIIDVKTIIDADNALFLIYSSSLFTNGLSAAAKT